MKTAYAFISTIWILIIAIIADTFEQRRRKTVQRLIEDEKRQKQSAPIPAFDEPYNKEDILFVDEQGELRTFTITKG